MKPIIFLDFDGVINTFTWVKKNGKLEMSCCSPSDMKVSNLDAIGWLNEIYEDIPFDIVVTSVWRMSKTIKQLSKILYNSYLNKNIKIIGKTDVLYLPRGMEIQKWLNDNEFKGKFVIVDDDSDMGELMPYLVRCDCYRGLGMYERNKIIRILEEDIKESS